MDTEDRVGALGTRSRAAFGTGTGKMRAQTRKRILKKPTFLLTGAELAERKAEDAEKEVMRLRTQGLFKRKTSSALSLKIEKAEKKARMLKIQALKLARQSRAKEIGRARYMDDKGNPRTKSFRHMKEDEWAVIRQLQLGLDKAKGQGSIANSPGLPETARAEVMKSATEGLKEALDAAMKIQTPQPRLPGYFGALEEYPPIAEAFPPPSPFVSTTPPVTPIPPPPSPPPGPGGVDVIPEGQVPPEAVVIDITATEADVQEIADRVAAAQVRHRKIAAQASVLAAMPGLGLVTTGILGGFVPSAVGTMASGAIAATVTTLTIGTAGGLIGGGVVLAIAGAAGAYYFFRFK